MPCTNIYDRQSDDYKESVLPASVSKRIAVEAGHGDFWYKYVGLMEQSSHKIPLANLHQARFYLNTSASQLIK